MPYEVSLVRCPHYRDETITAALTAVLAPLGGMASVVHRGQRVLIKLNLLSAHPPDHAVTTHPALAAAVVREVQACGGIPILGDSPGGVLTPAQFEALFEITGMRQVIEDTGCDWVNFDEETVTIVPERARAFKQFTMAAAPLKADVIIALPKLKTHQFMVYTGAVKLLYGYLPGVTKAEYHLHAGRSHDTFAEMLLDIHDTAPPALTIMDAVVGMEGDGPTHGDPREVGLLLAGHSAPALDFAMTHLIGLVPAQVPTVRVAARRGSGPERLEEITFYGEDPAEARILDFRQARTVSGVGMPIWLAEWASWLFSAWPAVDAAACRCCGRCVEFCPPQAMTMRPGSPPHIDLTACRRCYCCQELCPHDAVRVYGPRVSFPVGVGTALYGLVTRLQARKRR